jgi:hypothetical protein
VTERLGQSVFRKEEETALELSLDKGHYKIVVATFNPGVAKPFELTIYCDSDKFSSVACYENEQGHTEKLVQCMAGGAEGSEKWRIDWSEVVVEEGSLLGQGGYGVVYKGQYKGQSVAVKVVCLSCVAAPTICCCSLWLRAENAGGADGRERSCHLPQGNQHHGHVPSPQHRALCGGQPLPSVHLHSDRVLWQGLP